jgi:hypothetical protein
MSAAGPPKYAGLLAASRGSAVAIAASVGAGMSAGRRAIDRTPTRSYLPAEVVQGGGA